MIASKRSAVESFDVFMNVILYEERGAAETAPDLRFRPSYWLQLYFLGEPGVVHASLPQGLNPSI